jgi:ribonuclease HII
MSPDPVLTLFSDPASLDYPDSAGLTLERTMWRDGCDLIAGVDEAGRGCLAGPVVAAAVIFPRELRLSEVKDSKKLSARSREHAEALIRENAVAIGIGMCSPAEIDRLNILWASMEAMRRAVVDLSTTPDMLLIDGNRCFPGSPWPFRTIVRGDAVSHSIAAASIIAKTHRDRVMTDLARTEPDYCWATNKGYPTRDHYRALADHGPTVHHRRSFRLS